MKKLIHHYTFNKNFFKILLFLLVLAGIFLAYTGCDDNNLIKSCSNTTSKEAKIDESQIALDDEE